MDSRNVRVVFDDKNKYFEIFSEDGKPVLSGYPAEIIRSKGWIAISDGRLGKYAIIFAPKIEKNFIEFLFAKPGHMKETNINIDNLNYLEIIIA